MWRRKDTHRDNPVTMEERKSLMGEQETATMILFFLSKLKQLLKIDRPESRRSLIDTLITVDWLRPSWLCHRTILITVD
jgi:hypothetical protein